jgi:glycerol kinase
VQPGVWKKGPDGVEALRDMSVEPSSCHQNRPLTPDDSTGLPISTYFSAIKLKWMIDHYPEVSKAHESDDLLFGTVESWVLYVSSINAGR